MLLALSIPLCLPGVALANAGVPMIFLVMPVFGFSIIPIILIEAIYLSKKLQLTLSRAVKITTVSNIVSALFGVPLTWLVLVSFQVLAGGGGVFGLDTVLDKVLSVTLQAPWLIPYESGLHWMIPLAGMILLIPFFFVSWWIEYFVTMKILKDQPAKSVKIVVRNANILTYALLAFWPIGFWVLNNAPA